MSKTTVTLLLPGLWRSSSDVMHADMPCATRLLQRARRIPASSTLNSQLCSLFDYPVNVALPVASLTALVDGLAGAQYWLRADPVALQVDWVHVYLAGSAHAQVTPAVSNHLVPLLNQHLSHYDLTLVAPNRYRWYLRCPKLPAIRTHDPDELYGKIITDYLPSGTEGKYWLNVFTELQMILRSAAMGIDALWLWGAGELPALSQCSATWTTIMTDNSVALGLARHHVIPSTLLDSDMAHAIKQISNVAGRVLVCSERFTNDGDSSFHQSKQQLDTQLFAPIIRLLKQKQWMELNLYPGDGYCYYLSCQQLKPWWKFC